MAEIGIEEAQSQLAQLIEKAQKGEDIVITRHGRPVVRLSPMPPVPKTHRLAEVHGLFKDHPSVDDERFDALPPELGG